VQPKRFFFSLFWGAWITFRKDASDGTAVSEPATSRRRFARDRVLLPSGLLALLAGQLLYGLITGKQVEQTLRRIVVEA